MKYMEEVKNHWNEIESLIAEFENLLLKGKFKEASQVEIKLKELIYDNLK
jgi:hypothetical protein